MLNEASLAFGPSASPTSDERALALRTDRVVVHADSIEVLLTALPRLSFCFCCNLRLAG